MSVMIQLSVSMFFKFYFMWYKCWLLFRSVWFKRDWILWMKAYFQTIPGFTILKDP